MDNVNEALLNMFGPSPVHETSYVDFGSSCTPNANSDMQNVNETDGIDASTEDAFDEMVQNGPKSGMVFDSIDNLHEAYTAYAKVQVFSIFCRNKGTGKYTVIACDKGGMREFKKHTKKLDCPARINVIRQPSGYFMLSTVHLEHNHDLVPSMTAFMPGHRNLSLHMKRQLEATDIAGIRSSKNIKLLQVMSGGQENVGATEKDCRNFIDQRRRLRLGEGDAEAIQKFFQRLQVSDARFFHLIDIGDDSRLRNVMWIHPRSRVAYEDFHDVVSFDTTYLVNQYEMPLATVVGVNHHYQSMLLGCALLTHEHADSFKWFFRNWLEAMGGVHPTAILTDQCDSIRLAVREVMPDTVHRYCLWHICQKIPQKFKGVANYKKCKAYFYSLIYDSLSITEFERRWTEFLLEHSLQNNRWLRDLYAEKENWVPIYLNHLFWAGMVSTQRSESMHAFFDGYVHSGSTLKTFVEQYEIAVCDKIRKEMEADFKSKNVKLKASSEYMWEEQFARAYTLNVYKLLKEELSLIGNCNVEEVAAIGEDNINGVERYDVLELCMMRNQFHKQYTFNVEYRPTGGYFSCNCRKFESKGILCVHVMKVLVYKDVRHVNERYILRRWRKDVFRPHSNIVFAGGYPHMTNEYKMFQEMEREFQHCTDLAYGSLEKMNLVKEKCRDLKNLLMNWTAPASSPMTGAVTSILDPAVTRRRGRPRTNRLANPAERTRGRGDLRRQGSGV